MKKINLKSILKKTFKKKVVKKKKNKPVKKVSKNFKKKISNIKIKKPKKTNKKVVENLPNKQSNIKTIKGADQKPEIKKIKVQSSEKKEYKIKDYIVYPKHGVGQITDYKKINIGGIEVEAYILRFEKDKADGMVPVNKQSYLRPLATINQVNKCISILKSKPKIKRTMWSRRAQEYEQKINSGKLYQLAEVVKDLNKKTDVVVEQSYSERLLFEKAYERLKSEFEVVLGEKGKIKIDKALKRLESPTYNQPPE